MKKSLNRLLEALTTLPSIGPKTAQRIALYLLRNENDLAGELIQSITQACNRLHPCPRCFNLTEDELCEVCSNPARDHSIVCVVEEPGDVLTLEKSGRYRGAYHVLDGVVSPIDNIGPDELHIKELLNRITPEHIREVIIATNPTTEGEATAVYLARQLHSTGVLITRIARGLPVGSDLELADGETIARALEGRREI